MIAINHILTVFIASLITLTEDSSLPKLGMKLKTGKTVL